jgi:hypothetical protein
MRISSALYLWILGRNRKHPEGKHPGYYEKA